MLSECTRAYSRKLSKPHVDWSTRPSSFRASSSWLSARALRRLSTIADIFPRGRKNNLGLVLHAGALAFLLVMLAAMGAVLVTEERPGSFMGVVHGERAPGGGRTELTLRAVHRTLHTQFAVPAYFLARLAAPRPAFVIGQAPAARSAEGDKSKRLLEFLTQRMDSSVVAAARLGNAGGTPRVLFATIEMGTIGERVRAVASALAYAENTDRVPVIFWGVHPVQWNLSWTMTFANTTALAKQSLFVDFLVEDQAPAVSVDHPAGAGGGQEAADVAEDAAEEVTRDWAEFSVLDVAQSARPLDPSDLEAAAGRDREAPSFGKSSTRDDIRTLDSAASVDAHVSVSLTDEAVSRFAPRAQAAAHVANGALAGRGPFEVGAATAYAFEYALAGVSEETVLRRLHDSFEIPYLLTRGMRPEMRRKLMQSLVAKQATGVQLPRTIFVHAQYGLGNRLRALGSAMAFARETNRIPVLIWAPDHHLNCRFGDLFVEPDDVAVSDSFEVEESWPFDEQKSADPMTHGVAWYNYMRQNGVHVHDPSDLVVDDKQVHIYVSTAYVIQSPVTPYIIRTQSPFWRVLRALTPHIDVARLVERLDQMPMHKMMGVHIRSKRIDTDISGIGAEEYSKESSTRTDYWRNLTQVDTFVHEMRRQPSGQLFYVAADNVHALEQLQAEFPSRIFYTARRCDGRDRECLPFALADIILLSKCATIRGSYWSSFSEVAVRIGGGRVLLAGIDFGRPTVKTSKTTDGRTTLKARKPATRRRRKRLAPAA
jgi:hypothetical protein